MRVMEYVATMCVAACVGSTLVRGQQTMPAEPQAVATLAIDAGKPVAKVSPTLYGLMTEEINYSYDGGLYGEMVQDRTFLSGRSDPTNWLPVPMGTVRTMGSISKSFNK